MLMLHNFNILWGILIALKKHTNGETLNYIVPNFKKITRSNFSYNCQCWQKLPWYLYCNI